MATGHLRSNRDFHGPARVRATLAALSVLVCPAAARAAEPGETHAAPCRPTTACTADLVAPGAFEFEAGAIVRRDAPDATQWSTPFLLKMTLVPWLQLQAGSNGYTRVRGDASAEYFDDATVGAKFHFLDQKDWVPSLALSATASLPTAFGNGYTRTLDGIFVAHVSKDFGPLHVDFNVGEHLWRIEKSPQPQEYFALALSTSIPDSPIGLAAEVYYFSDQPPLAGKDGGVLFAVSHSPRPWLVFDFGTDIGMFPSIREYSLFFGATIVPVLLWK